MKMIEDTAAEQVLDIFLELTFLTKYQLHPTREYFNNRVKEIGYIYKLATVFWPCIDRQSSGLSCPYSNVRFHYTDVRLGFEATAMDKNIDWKLQYVTLETYLLNQRFKTCLKILRNWETESAEADYIEDTKVLIDYFYLGQTLNQSLRDKNIYKYFQIQLLSQNYIEDVLSLISDLHVRDKKSWSELNTVLFNPNLIVERDNKIMTRIGTQLYELTREGQALRAEQIVDFVTHQYKERQITELEIGSWLELYSIYQQLTTRTFMTLTTLNSDLDQLAQTVTNFENTQNPNVALPLEALLMDTYLLGRLFRSYPNKQHISSNKVIVYAGLRHVNLYKEFFEQYLGVSFYTQPEIDTFTRCIVMPKTLFFD